MTDWGTRKSRKEQEQSIKTCCLHRSPSLATWLLLLLLPHLHFRTTVPFHITFFLPAESWRESLFSFASDIAAELFHSSHVVRSSRG